MPYGEREATIKIDSTIYRVSVYQTETLANERTDNPWVFAPVMVLSNDGELYETSDLAMSGALAWVASIHADGRE